ncbi:hypothetical protein E2562_025386 [Oryza meyeriana var. granulata]|uniref:Uncharacterized protein n=1 Tax=Oryza meyeriana var. granulata TaxID=110450 RepID=A0A6G1DMB4_9ORYZ|nr:hypothetical protein E2562_025386 [Oryza meyeriana var. granulata]
MVECTKQTIGALRDAAVRGRREVEIGAHMTRLTGDIISRTEFNTSYDTGKRIFTYSRTCTASPPAPAATSGSPAARRHLT